MLSQGMNCCFAIIPENGLAPVAVFEDLEDAMDWAVRKFGSGKFSIRHVAMTEAPRPDAATSTSSN